MEADRRNRRVEGKEAASLGRNVDFLKLWTGQSVSLIGSQITVLALPLAAALSFKAAPVQLGILVACWNAPNILSFVAGVWVDRMRRKPILIMTDLVRALILLIVVVCAGAHLLRIELLYVVALLLGICSVIFDVAYVALLPALLRADQLVEGNAKLQASDAAARIVGPSLGGWLVQLLTAPVAMTFDALSFLVSVLSLLLIRSSEAAPSTREARPGILQDILAGAGFVWRQPLIRPMLICTAIWNLADSIIFAVYILYATRELRLAPGALGLTFSVASLGFLAGATMGPRIQKHVGLGPSIVLGCIVEGLGVLLLPLARGAPCVTALVLGTAQFIVGLGFPMVAIGSVSLRQAITPDRMLGRVSATWRSVTWGVLPFGNLLGGVLGHAVGLRGAVAVGAIGGFLAFFPVLFSPLRTLRELPSAVPRERPRPIPPS